MNLTALQIRCDRQSFVVNRTGCSPAQASLFATLASVQLAVQAWADRVAHGCKPVEEGLMRLHGFYLVESIDWRGYEELT